MNRLVCRSWTSPRTRRTLESLVTASLDGNVGKQSNTVFAVGEEAIVPPGVRVGLGRDDPLQGVVKGSDLRCVVGEARSSDPF